MVKTNIADALQDKIDSKAAIKTALNLKGLTITNELQSEYAAKIADLPSSLALKKTIEDWQASTDYVRVGGYKEASWIPTNDWHSNRTIIFPRRCIFSKTTIKHIRIYPKTATGAAWKFKLFRYNVCTALYDFVSESTFTPSGNVAQTCTLTTPLEAEVSDIIGLYIPTGNTIWSDDSVVLNVSTRNVNSTDVVTSNAFTGTTDVAPCIDVFGTRSYLGFASDSIVSGFNGGTTRYWCPMWGSIDGLKTIPGGELPSEQGSIVRQIIGSHLHYQNHGNTNTKWSHAVSTYVPELLAAKTHDVVLSWGTNDISERVTWATVLGQMNQVKTLFDASSSVRLFICEIIPRTGFDDTMAATIRTWNANIAAWCTANNAILIQTHDAMGKIRVATGQIDDLKTSYDFDSCHLTYVGVAKLAEIIANAIIQ